MRSLVNVPAVIAMLAITATLSAADDPLKWNKSAEAYFMTAAEKAEWKNVFTPQDARRFIDEFYRKRGDQFRKDVLTRVDIADKNFKLDKVRGSETQKGRVFMLLGPPNTSRTNREVEDTRLGISLSNVLENKALLGTQWLYERDRLPKEMGISRLEVNFIYDARRGFESIDNLATVEPRLQQAAEIISNRYMQAAQTQTAARSLMPSDEPAAVTDPLWSATPSLNGALFTGDAFLSAREEPFYAFTFFVPKNAEAGNPPCW